MGHAWVFYGHGRAASCRVCGDRSVRSTCKQKRDAVVLPAHRVSASGHQSVRVGTCADPCKAPGKEMGSRSVRRDHRHHVGPDPAISRSESLSARHSAVRRDTLYCNRNLAHCLASSLQWSSGAIRGFFGNSIRFPGIYGLRFHSAALLWGMALCPRQSDARTCSCVSAHRQSERNASDMVPFIHRDSLHQPEPGRSAKCFDKNMVGSHRMRFLTISRPRRP